MGNNNAMNTQETLDRLKRDELRYLLAEELAKDSTDIDEAFVRLLLSELESRGADPAFAEDENVEAACEKFCKSMEKSFKEKKKWNQGWLLKVASVVLVLGILFFTLPGTAKANSVQKVLAWWSDSVFQFFSPGQRPSTQEYVYNTNHPGLQQIYDAVTELGITDPVVPSWVPVGFELIELKQYEIAGDSVIYGNLKNNERSVLITIAKLSAQNMLQHEKDVENINIWDLAGVEHYVLSNKDEWIVTWIGTEFECAVVTDCSKEEVHKIIKSIYSMEG